MCPTGMTDPDADDTCTWPDLCANVAPPGYLGQIIPMQSIDSGAACYESCLGNKVSDVLGGCVCPTGMTDPDADNTCTWPDLCENVAPPGYLGTIIPMQNIDSGAVCYGSCPGNKVSDGVGGCVCPTGMTDPDLDNICTLPPLCWDVAPPGYLGIVLPMQKGYPCLPCFDGFVCEGQQDSCYTGPLTPMQSTDSGAACYEVLPALCFNVAPLGYLGQIIPMQSTDPDGICYLGPPPSLSVCTALTQDDLSSPSSGFGTDVPGLSITLRHKRGSLFYFRVSWPGHEGESVRVGAEYRDAYGRHSSVERPYLIGDTRWNFRTGQEATISWFTGQWVTDAYANHIMVWVNTSQGHACHYFFERENYGGTPRPLDRFPPTVDCPHLHDVYQFSQGPSAGSLFHSHFDIGGHTHPSPYPGSSSYRPETPYCLVPPNACSHTHNVRILAPDADRPPTGALRHEHAKAQTHSHPSGVGWRYNSASCTP